MIGFGPIGAHCELNVADPVGRPSLPFFIPSALLAPLDRCRPACSTLRGLSPAVRDRMKSSLSAISFAASS